MGAAMALEQDVYNTITMKVRTPDGTMFVIVLEDKEAKPCGIQINIGKAGSSLSAWANATAALVSRMLGAGVGLNDIIKELSEMTSDKTTLTGEQNVPIRSGPDGLCYALMLYKRAKFQEHAATFESDESYRPPQAAI